jgi:hypothetical protein
MAGGIAAGHAGVTAVGVDETAGRAEVMSLVVGSAVLDRNVANRYLAGTAVVAISIVGPANVGAGDYIGGRERRYALLAAVAVRRC